MMATNVATGLEIEFEDSGESESDSFRTPHSPLRTRNIRPVTWEEWITLPIRDQDEAVHTVRGQIRVPTVIVAVMEEAQERGEPVEVDRLDCEIGALEEAMEGYGVTGDAGERARCNVSKAMAALRRELARGGQHDFCRHIEQFVSLGYECVYNQPEGRVWE